MTQQFLITLENAGSWNELDILGLLEDTGISDVYVSEFKVALMPYKKEEGD